MITLRAATINVETLQESDEIDYAVTAADTHEAHTFQANAKYLLLSTDVGVYVKKGDTSFSIPAANITDGTGPIFIPAGGSRLVNVSGSTAIGLRSVEVATVAIEAFA